MVTQIPWQLATLPIHLKLFIYKLPPVYLLQESSLPLISAAMCGECKVS